MRTFPASTFLFAGLVLSGFVFAQSPPLDGSSGSSSTPDPSANNSTIPSNSTNTGSGTPPNSNPLIPSSSISEQCSNFLADLNGNQALKSCTDPILNTLSAFSPVDSGFGSSSVNDTLNKLCTTGIEGCSDSSVRTLLTYFSGNCTTELHANNQIVKSSYDALYMVQPFRSALCARDTKTEGYCLVEIASGTSPSNGDGSPLDSTVPTTNGTVPANNNAVAAPDAGGKDAAFNIQQYADPALDPSNLFLSITTGQTTLQKRDDPSNSSETAAAPNATTFRNGGLPFLFLSGQMDSNMLCTQCTKTVMLRYLQWESSIPYASGLASSGFLGGQSDLWAGLTSKCGSGFTNDIQEGTGTGDLDGGARVGMDKLGITKILIPWFIMGTLLW